MAKKQFNKPSSSIILPSTQDFINYWNNNIQAWASHGGMITPDESYWAPYAPKIGIITDLIPEPYYGNPNKCSIVILNYNPGDPSALGRVTQHISNASNPNTVCGRMAPLYSKVALSFPVLGSDNPSNPHHVTSGPLPYDGRPWWLNKENWLNQVIGYTGITSGLNPFALELCGWHSRNWRGVHYSQTLLTEIKNRLEAVLTQSICASDTQLGVCIGVAFGDYVLPALGFDQLPMPTSLNGFINSSKTKNRKKPYYYSLNKDKSRGYRLFKHRETGALMINTWAPGGNGSPSISDFGYFDQMLVQEIYRQRLQCCLCSGQTTASGFGTSVSE